MKILAIDQSLSKCAYVTFEEGVVKSYGVFKTGNAKVKTKRKDTLYLDTLQEQVHHICNNIIEVVDSFEPDHITFEALSFGSVGNASRDLACLYGAIRERLMFEFKEIPCSDVPPTSLKSFAHSMLPEDSKWDGMTKAKKPKKIKMDKKMMVLAVKTKYGKDYLSEYNYSTGLDDLADATLLALKYYEETK